eukprot:SAG31_NODE_1167_length_9572_cov_3.794046_8_plen_47_part_00
MQHIYGLFYLDPYGHIGTALVRYERGAAWGYGAVIALFIDVPPNRS